MIAVSIAGATGFAGSALVPAVLAAEDLELRSAVARQTAGRDLGEARGGEPLGVPIHGTVAEALEGVDVLVEYTSHLAARENVLTALDAGVAVVVGSSGLSAEDYAEIDARARERGLGVVAAGNFSLTAALMQAAALLAARHLPSWEVVDYASAGKRDAPSGTARELAERLADVRRPALEVAAAETSGAREARGTDVSGTQVHSVRLPGYVVTTEIVFGLPDERLVIRHEAGSSAEPYVAGALLAIRAAPQTIGLVRGLDRLLVG